MLDITIRKIDFKKILAVFTTMRFRIAVTCFLIILCALFFMSVYVINMVKSSLLDDEKTDMFMKANIISALISEKVNGDAKEYEMEAVITENLSGTGIRAVVVNGAYKVIYDSNSDNNADGLFVRGIVHDAVTGMQNSDIKNITLSVAVPINDGGAVYLEQDIDGIERMVGNVQISLIMFSVIICIFVTIFSMATSYLITSPLKVFIDTAGEISKGNFKTRIKINGTNEITELAETMNYMCAELEHIDEKRRKFVSDASHELKTPMATIKLICDTIVSAEKPDMEMVRDFLNDLSEEIDRLTRIVERLLKLTKIESGKEELTPELADYGMLLKRIENKIQPGATGKNITISSDVMTEDMQPVFIDYDKIWEAVYNIVDNAVKYSKPGGVVRIEAYVSGKELVTRITDEGPGIPDEYKERIFERFYRVDDSRARNTGGTGLGLAITKEIILMHGGSVSVHDAENEGSVFEIILPYRTASDIQTEVTDTKPDTEVEI